MEQIVKDFIKELGYSENIIDTDHEKRVDGWLKWLGGKTKYHDYYTYNGKKKVKRTMKSLNIASQSCGDLADFFFNEKLDITIDKPSVEEKIKECLEQNDFLYSSNNLMQLVKALGIGAYVTYLDNDVLKINYINATNIVILDSDNKDVKSILTWSKSQTIKGTEIYINAHILGDDGYTVYNRKYIKKSDSESYEKEDLGDTEKIETKSYLPKFSVIRTPEVNNLELNSSYGISCYANATDSILAIDEAFDSLDNEIWIGRKRVYVKGGAAKFNVDEEGNATPIFDASDVAYYQVPGDDKDPLITESKFDLRVEELTQALQGQLNIYTAKVGLGHNYYKFKDGEAYVNTSNVISANSDVYRKIKKQENIITSAIKQLIYGIAELIGINEEFSISIFYDDSIIEDTENIRKQAQTEYNSGLISKAQYYRDVYKLGDEEALNFAKQMNKEIKEETITNGEEPSFIE